MINVAMYEDGMKEELALTEGRRWFPWEDAKVGGEVDGCGVKVKKKKKRWAGREKTVFI